MVNDERGRQNSHALISKQEKGDGEEEPHQPNSQPTSGAEGQVAGGSVFCEQGGRHNQITPSSSSSSAFCLTPRAGTTPPPLGSPRSRGVLSLDHLVPLVRILPHFCSLLQTKCFIFEVSSYYFARTLHTPKFQRLARESNAQLQSRETSLRSRLRGQQPGAGGPSGG